MKGKNYILGALMLMLLATSCLKSNTSTTVISDEAEITQFYLYSDSVKGIENYVFTIDNDSMLIYNYDSIDYGTRIDSLSFVLNPRFSSVYINDSLNYYALSEIYLDFSKEVKFTVVASDGKTSADYRVRVNVHKVDPDTFVWDNISAKVFDGNALSSKAVCLDERLIYMAVVDNELLVYESINGELWNKIVPTGLDVDYKGLDLNNLCATDEYLYLCVDGKLYRSVDGGTWMKVETLGEEINNLLFAMNGELYGVVSGMKLAKLKGNTWTIISNLSSSFPVKGSAVMAATAPSGKSRVFVVGGIDVEGRFLSTVWSSDNGEYWTELTGGKELFTPRAYAAIAQYGGGLMLFGGIGQTESGSMIDTVVVKDSQLFSKDFGMTWGKPKDKSKISDAYLHRYGHSAVVTPSGYLYLIGGRTSVETAINDVWRGLNYASLPGFRR